MKINKVIITVFLAILLVSNTALACGPYFDDAYLVRGTEKGFLAIPEGSFLFELEKISGKKYQKPKEDENVQENTADADVIDLENALKNTNLSEKAKKKVLSSYADARSKMLYYLKEYPVERKWEWYGGTFRQHERDAGSNQRIPLNINLNLDKNLPEEFKFYIEGAVDYHNYDFDKAINAWNKILSLPADKRQYRSVWAAFMIGKSYLSARRQKDAIKYFIQTRELSKQGFKDSLDLSKETYGWQALAECETKDYAESIKHYLESLDINSLNWVCRRVLDLDKSKLKEIVKDDIARQVLASWIISHWYDGFYYNNDPATKTTRAQVFLKALESANIKGTVQEADRIAWIYYNMGDFENTKKWLKLSQGKTALSKWINIKLLIKNGKIEQAIRGLQDLVDTFEKNDEWGLFYDGDKQDITRRISQGLGVLRLSRQEYIMAFEVLLKGAFWEDIAYIAEMVLTPEELENILIQHKDVDLPYNEDLGYSEFIENPSLYKSLEYLLARRYARLGNWDKAIEYMPAKYKRYWYPQKTYGTEYEDINLKDLTKRLSSYIKNSENSKLNPGQRAENYYQAGLLMRKYGMEITGTELEPDWFVFNGQYEYNSALETRFAILTEERDKLHYAHDWWKDELDEMAKRRKRLKTKRDFFDGTKEEEKRAVSSLPEPFRRFHYRYKAADLMWKAAELLPDNDSLKAKALYLGGTYLKIRYPEEANKFYKALVATCPNTELGKEAKKAKWFPKDIELE